MLSLYLCRHRTVRSHEERLLPGREFGPGSRPKSGTVHQEMFAGRRWRFKLFGRQLFRPNAVRHPGPTHTWRVSIPNAFRSWSESIILYYIVLSKTASSNNNYGLSDIGINTFMVATPFDRHYQKRWWFFRVCFISCRILYMHFRTDETALRF